MKSIRPLLQGGSDAERLLLSAGASERPDPERMRSAARGLGLVPRTLTVVAALVVAIRAAKGSSLAALGLGPLVSVAALGVALRVVHRPSVAVAQPGDPSEPAGQTAAPPLAPPLPLPGSVPEERREQPIHAPTLSTPAGQAARAPARPKPASASASLASALRDQAGALDRVRVLIGAGDPDAALAALEDFDRRYAGGPLSEEALLLRIEALARRGDRSAAGALASSFLRAHPASVHVDRVRALSQALAP